MSKFIVVGLLSLFLLKVQVGNTAPVAPQKAVSKDTEINDPFLEEELQETIEEEDLDKEALEARGNVPIEENPPPPAPAPLQAAPTPPKPAETPSIPPPSSAKKEMGEPKVDSSISGFPEKPLNPKATSLEKGSTVKGVPRPSSEGLPRWNAKDPRKGFIGSSDEEGYFYKEESSDQGREYSGDYKIVPKAKNYQRGLKSVASDGSYIYAPDESEMEGSASLRVSSVPPLPIEKELTNTVLTFEDMYGSDSLVVALVDYDWLTFKKAGHWVVNVGTGIGTAEGQGRFIDDGTEANEKYTFYMLLNHLSFIYRFQYTPHPWLVPYVSVGVMPTVLLERRDDDKRNKAKLIPAGQASGGVRINIGKLGDGIGALDAEYGINNMWLDLEYRRVQSLHETVDISSNLFNAGIGFDF